MLTFRITTLQAFFAAAPALCLAPSAACATLLVVLLLLFFIARWGLRALVLAQPVAQLLRRREEETLERRDSALALHWGPEASREQLVCQVDSI